MKAFPRDPLFPFSAKAIENMILKFWKVVNWQEEGKSMDCMDEMDAFDGMMDRIDRIGKMA